MGLAPQNTYGYLLGGSGWNAAQAGVLDGIPVLLIAGSFLNVANGDPEFWPNDGLVSNYSALATDISEDILPLRTCKSYPFLHSIFIADALGEEWDTSMTWNDTVLTDVVRFLDEVQSSLQ